MEAVFTIKTVQDAVVARAMLDGMIAMHLNPTAVQTSAPSAGQVSPSPSNAAEPDTTDTETGAPVSKEEIKVAAMFNPTLAELVGKRGKKSQDTMQQIYRLTLEVKKARPDAFVAAPAQQTVQPQQPIGEALAGASPQDLQTALKQMPLVSSDAGVEVRTAPAAGAGTPVGTGTAGGGLPAFFDQTGSGAVAMQPAALAQLQQGAPAQADPTAQPAQPASATQIPPVQATVIPTGRDALYKQIQAYAEGGAGLFWFRNVIEKGGGDAAKLTPEYMQQVLSNPEAYHPA